MTKVLIATEKPFAAPAVAAIKDIVSKAGYETVLLEKYTEKSQLLAAVADVDAIIIRSDKIDKEVFDAAKNLKIVVRAGAGYDNVDLAEATAHNVCVMNTPGQNSNAVAELVMGLLVFNARNQFNGKSGSELKDKKMGILAYGNVGRNVARIAKGFGMEIFAYDAFVPAEAIKESGATPIATVPELFATCDVISLHAPATPETIKSINYDLLMKMPKDAVLINSARKEIIDEEGVLRALTERTDLRYLTDIMPANHEAMVVALGDRYFSTPKKMGAQTGEANNNAGIAAANQIVDFIANGVEKFRVNK
ncbi:NAD(P)-dependent oxidoreductase [Porphyromonas endodontalis]|jgi:D-isomer specific 2-hydroxyacid dehydrogenase, catalytic domain protein|uniref:NAD(P)-dependent oxidoreductase n=1 Tax=Porphyromonas endodontalis TaxID=28124 RepID=UPI003C7AFEB8